MQVTTDTSGDKKLSFQLTLTITKPKELSDPHILLLRNNKHNKLIGADCEPLGLFENLRRL